MKLRAVRLVVALATALGAGLPLACGGRGDAPSSVVVQLLEQDSAHVRFRVCNNGFQPIRRVEFTAGGASFAADTLLDQAHCAEIARPGAQAPLDPTSLAVTRVEGP